MKIFSIENPVFAFISRVGDMFILSFIWLIASLPIFTIGASTTAAYDCAFKIIRARDTNVFKDFIRSFKSNFKQSTIIFLILLPIGALIGVDLWFWSQQDGDMAFVMNALSIGIAALFIVTYLYVFPVQAVFENPVKKTLKTAFLMAVSNWWNSLLLLAACIAVSYLCYVFPIVGYVFLLVGTGTFTMIFAVRFLVVFRKYNPELMPDRPEASDMDSIEKPKAEKKCKIKRGKNKIIS